MKTLFALVAFRTASEGGDSGFSNQRHHGADNEQLMGNKRKFFSETIFREAVFLPTAFPSLPEGEDSGFSNRPFLKRLKGVKQGFWCVFFPAMICPQPRFSPNTGIFGQILTLTPT